MECKKCGKEFEGEQELCPTCAEENLPEEVVAEEIIEEGVQE